VAVLVGSLLAGIGCEKPPLPALAALPPLPMGISGDLGAAGVRVNGDLGGIGSSQPIQSSIGISPGGTVPQSGATFAEGNISLDFVETDIREVATQILGTILKVNYSIDPAVHGTATIRTVVPLAPSQLLPTLQALLAQSGAALVRSGTLYRVVAATGARPIADGGVGADSTAGSTVVPLR
jgi:general secretion pathway protein D